MAATSKESVSTRFAEFAAGFDGLEIPEAVCREAKLHILDALGCAVAAVGSGEQAPAQKVLNLRSRAGACSVIGREDRVDPLWAAFGNATLVQAMDYDDTHPEAVCHVSSVITPTMLATTEEHGGSGADALGRYVLGSELTSRIGGASEAGFISRGIHPTSVCGVFGAAALAGAAMGLAPERIADALGIAGSHASGILVCLSEGVEAKPLHAGAAARNGIFAAELAAAGAPGPRGVFEGPAGLFQAFTGEDHLEQLEQRLADLGERWMTAEIAVKAMPVCHYQQGALEAAKGIGVAAAEIESVELGIDPVGIPIVLEPIAEKVAPVSTYQARFSLPYCAAVTLVKGQIDIGDLTGAVGDPEVERLAASVSGFALAPGDRGDFAGEVILRLKSGETKTARVDHPLGTPARPMGEADVLAKYRENAELGFGDERGGLLEGLVLELEDLDSLDPITTLLRGCRS